MVELKLFFAFFGGRNFLISKVYNISRATVIMPRQCPDGHECPAHSLGTLRMLTPFVQRGETDGAFHLAHPKLPKLIFEEQGSGLHQRQTVNAV